MGNEHLEFEQLAVEHVLGGLAPEASARFRDHLIECGDCRRHVVELRGIASDLDLAARQERAVVRTKPETVHDESEDSSTERVDRVPWTPSYVRGAVIVVLAIALAVIAFWNIHLRQVVLSQEQALEARGEVLDILVEGEVVPLTSVADDLLVDVAATDRVVAVNAQGVPELSPGQRLVLWGLMPGMDGSASAWSVLAFAGADGVPGGRAALAADLAGHTELLLAVEDFPLGTGPAGATLFTADLPR